MHADLRVVVSMVQAIRNKRDRTFWANHGDTHSNNCRRMFQAILQGRNPFEGGFND